MDTVRRWLRPGLTGHDTLRLGVITVLVIVVVLAAALGVGRLGLGKTSYTADFAQAAGIAVGDQVTVTGVNVGSVRGVRLAGDRVVVTMDIDRNLRLGTATRASIKLTTLLGARYVDVEPAGPGRIADNRIPLAQTEVPYDLQTALQDATTTFEAVDAERIAESMTTLSAQLQGAPEVLPQALHNVEHLSSVLSLRRDQVGAMLQSTKQVTQLLGEQRQKLGLLMTQGLGVLGDLVARQELVVRMINATTTLVNQLRPILVDDRPYIDQLLADLDNMLTAVAENEELFRNTLQVMPVPLRNFTNATGTANEFDFTSSGGTLIDTFMCAISGRAQQFNLPNYFQDCA
ncbi:MCE family protein [Mycolicibacterium thermoresistibile]